jgi:predicted short-subunit dehydrogenase-like oxidoreductase (DUF2520 family)
MPSKPKIAIVGPGNLGGTLALALHKGGYVVEEIVFRESSSSRARALALAKKLGARASTMKKAALSADLVWLSVPDRAIAECARNLVRRAEWKGKIVLHSSGALSSMELKALQGKGATVASLHPFMTFVPGSAPSLEGIAFAVEGDAPAVRIARRIAGELGGKAFVISQKNKAAYHALGSFSSPLLVALLVTAERVAQSAGIDSSSARSKMLPILRQTLANYAEKGAAGAFSGPIIRGDIATVRKHLQVLKKVPGAREVYLALAGSALRNLPIGNRRQLTKLLGARRRGSG